MAKPGVASSRRSILKALVFGLGVAAVASFLPRDAWTKKKRAAPKKSGGVAKAPVDEAANLKPGQFVWHPERSPEGPVAIIVSVPKQRAFVYRNGILIGVSTVSTGKKGFDTPAGVFTILEKDKDHYSREFEDAAMPHMERLTWGGVALHAGKLPGYPASHGCVRLPAKFAQDLYEVTQIGTPVIIADDYTNPAQVSDPGPILGSSAKAAMDAKAGKKAKGSSGAVTSILISRADKRIYVLQNGDIVAQGEAMIEDPSKPLGSNVFVWRGGDPKGSTWDAMGFHVEAGGAKAPSTAALERIDGEPEVMEAIVKHLAPGTVLVTTDLPATPETRSGKDFVVIDGPAS
jgi:hypothetical protein